ncbi:phosphoglycerate kinase [Candidatus Pelagibacter sp.]|nr:phosphoglycerate kinase [Candidatus Pelagibacter sp.]
MNNIKDQKDLHGKIVLLRLDLNVPISNNKITDETRIDKILPILNYLIKKKSKIVVISHIGRPNGKVVKELSLQPICENLENKINKKIKLIKEDIFKLTKKQLFDHTTNEIVFLENIRFYEQEENNDIDFSRHLASLGDLYINDAFSCSHRAHASVSHITEFIPSYAGLQLEMEIRALKKLTTEIKKPITCIIGGSKISTKITVIQNLIPKVDHIIIVGGMANNILKYKGHSIGKSTQESNCETIIENIFKSLNNSSCTITYPEDVVIGKHMEDIPTTKELNEIMNDDIILDIGPKTIEKINDIIENSKTILWNGPAGYFENTNFSKGSFEIGKKIEEKNKLKQIFSVAGGGDTVALLNKIGIANSFNFVSTAGGAFLEYLEGKELPGIKALK